MLKVLSATLLASSISVSALSPPASASQRPLISLRGTVFVPSPSLQRLMAARRKVKVTGAFPPGIKEEIQRCLGYGYEPGWSQGDEHVECVVAGSM